MNTLTAEKVIVYPNHALTESDEEAQLSHEKNPANPGSLTFHCTGWIIGILIVVYYNPHITG